MGSDYTDKLRLLQFTADGKTDLLLPGSFSASERISGLFQIHVDLQVAPEKVGQVQPSQLIGKRMTLRVALGSDYNSGPYRYFDGVCNRFASGGVDRQFSYFEADLVPWAWMLTKRADFRVFQDKSIPDIVEEILRDLQGDFSDFKFEMRVNRGQHKKLDYCVQFRETQFNFISRLLEQDGIYYYFKHSDSGHTLIIDDSLVVGGDVPNQAEVTHVAHQKSPLTEDHITHWREERIIHSGSFAANDYHYQMAQNKIEFSGIKTATTLGRNDKLEIFEWPGGSALRYIQPDQRLDEVNPVGNTLTNLRAQESETTHHTFMGASGCRGFCAGFRFSMKHDPGTKYLLTSIHHAATQDASYINEESAPSPYSNSFESISADLQFRPPRVTAKPLVDGMQSARVVGKNGEEIWIDKYGRVRVQFFWDRKGKNDETSTCWVRVAQVAAGKRWGASFWPRIGQEVVVAFLEGDPDQPVIVGTVYNNQQMPPYLGDGPDDKHKHDPNVSGIKSNSTKGGDGFNELRFTDTKDKEQVFIHAEKDLDIRVKHETREHTVADRHIIVGDENSSDGNLFQNVWQNWQLQTLKNKQERIEGNSFLTIGTGSNSSGGNYQEYVEKDTKEYVGGDRHLKVVGDRTEEVTGNYSQTLGQSQIKVNQSAAMEVAQSLHLKAMTIVIEADMQLSLKVGGNFVDISVAGVAINGMPMVMINSGGAAGSAPDASPATAKEAEKFEKPADSTFHRADDSKTGSKSCD